MKILILLLVLVSCAQNSKNITHRVKNYKKFSVMQAYTDSKSTVIRVVSPLHIKPEYKVFDSKNNEIKISRKNKYKRSFSEFAVEHLYIRGLNVEEHYTLSISSSVKGWSEKRYFKSLDDNGNKLKILVASCMTDTYNEVGNQIWPKALSHNPDVIFLTGDNIYADVYSGIYLGSQVPTKPNHLWNRHIDHAMQMAIYRAENLKPVFTTWDDHDYGTNNGNKSYKYKNESLEIYKLFFPQGNNDYLKRGIGIGNALTLRGNNFLFLDGRTYRDSPDNKKGYHFGKKQRSWIQRQIKKNGKYNWLIAGDQFFGGYHKYESFEGDHPEQFRKFLKELKDLNEKYVFISGDRHLLEVMKVDKEHIGHSSFEYTVSGIHTKMYPGSLKRDPNNIRVDGFDGEPNYAIFNIEKKNDSLEIGFEGYNLNSKKVNRLDIIK